MATPAMNQSPELLPVGVTVTRTIALVADVADLAALDVVVEWEARERFRADQIDVGDRGIDRTRSKASPSSNRTVKVAIASVFVPIMIR